jgi:hypothetical protein
MENAPVELRSRVMAALAALAAAKTPAKSRAVNIIVDVVDV